MRALLLLICLALAAPAPAEEMRRIGGWFKVDEAAALLWEIEAEEEMRVRLTRKGAAEGPARRIFVVYPRKSSAYDAAMSTLLKDFAARPIAVEFLAVNYGGDEKAGAAIVAEAAQEGAALIYAMGSETVEWLHSAHPGIATPVVTVCAKDPVQLGQIADYETGSGTAFAFTSLNLRTEVELGYLKELKPELRAVGILVDLDNVSAVETQARPMMRALRAAGIAAVEIGVRGEARARADLEARIPEALTEMRAADPDLSESLLWITGSTAVFSEMETINAHAGDVPVLGVAPELVGEGEESAALSIGVSFESNAALAAYYGSEILSGARSPGEMPVGIVSPPDIAISFLRARRIGLAVPFSFFETASFVYGPEGQLLRASGG